MLTSPVLVLDGVVRQVVTVGLFGQRLRQCSGLARPKPVGRHCSSEEEKQKGGAGGAVTAARAQTSCSGR